MSEAVATWRQRCGVTFKEFSVKLVGIAFHNKSDWVAHERIAIKVGRFLRIIATAANYWTIVYRARWYMSHIIGEFIRPFRFLIGR
jgi:hypothetical protein